MKNSKRTPHTLRGAVLIMVMTVMFVLIFLLAGTIAVVYSAHNRAMVKYEESQAYYTARSLLDAYLDNFLKDGSNETGDASLGAANTTAVNAYSLKSTTGLETEAAMQGRALELDLYGLKVSVADENAAPFLASETYPYTGKETCWAAGSNYANDMYLNDWVKQYILDIATGGFTYNPTDECGLCEKNATHDYKGNTGLEHYRHTYASAPATAAAYADARAYAMQAINSSIADFKHPGGQDPADDLDIEIHAGDNYEDYYEQFVVSESGDTLYYRVPAGTFKDYGMTTIGGTNGRFGKIADTFTDNKTDAIIKVQLLERTFHLSKDGTDFKYKFDKGNREKDHYKIRVTCEVMYDGVATTTSVIYANKYDPKPSNQNALTAVGGIDTASSGFPVSGGFTSLDGDSTTKLNAAAASGSVFVEGNLVPENSGTINLFGGESYTVIHDFNVTNSMTFNALGDKTFFYVGGNINVNNQFTFGQPSDTYKVDVIANQINWSSNPMKVSGNLYADALNMVNDGNFNGLEVGGNLYVNDIITRHDNNGNGMKVISTVADGGSNVIQVKDTGFYSGGTIVSGRLIYRDYYSSNDGSEHSVYNSAEDKALGITNKDLVIDVNTDSVTFVDSSGNPSDKIAASSNKVKLDYNDKNAFTFGGDNKKTFTMPDGKQFTLDTHQSKFKEYYPDECFNDDSVGEAGAFKDEYYSTKTDPVTGQTVKYLDKTKLMADTNMESAEDIAKREANAGDDCKLTSYSTISGGSISVGNYVLTPGNVGNMTVDTSGGKVVIQLSSGDYSGTINVTGSGEVKLLIPAGATCNWGGSGNGFSVVYADTMANGNTIYVGDVPTGQTATAVPNIDVYAGKGSSINVNEGGGVHSLLTGYIYGPAAHVNVNMGKQNFTYNKDGQSVGGANYFVVGSVVCGEYKSNSSDRTGVAFIDRNAATKKAGEPNFAWTDVYYQRGE